MRESYSYIVSANPLTCVIIRDLKKNVWRQDTIG